MSWEPGVVKFGHEYYEYPKENFDPKEYCRIQADYLLQHSEVTAITALFVARMARKSMKNVNVLKEAGLFFKRPAGILKQEIKQELKRTGKLDFKPDIMKKQQSMPFRRAKLEEAGPCPCPTVCTPSVESIYSEFVTESTSTTTLPPEEAQGIVTPTLEEAMEQLITKALDTGLNTMYAAREREIVYDEAYLCLIGCLQKAVEAKWNPVIDHIKCLIDMIIDNVRQKVVQRHRLKLIMMDKVPIKTNRLRHHFKGFTSEELPPPSRKEVIETLSERQGTYNRYPKDAFGVYVSSWDQSFDESMTREPDPPEYECSSDDNGPLQLDNNK